MEGRGKGVMSLKGDYAYRPARETSAMVDISTCSGRNRYTEKDTAKAALASKYIGRGSPRSSTDAYRRAIGPSRANTGNYERNDVVWISAEGARSNRIDPDVSEITLATAAGATIITDTAPHRERPYNVGERQVAAILARQSYRETHPGCWTPDFKKRTSP